MGIIKFLASNIKKGKTTYEQVILSRPDLKDELYSYLIETGLSHLITEGVQS